MGELQERVHRPRSLWALGGVLPHFHAGLAFLLLTPEGSWESLIPHRLLSRAEMSQCHLENSWSSQTACSAGLISIGNLLMFIQLYIIDNGKMLPRGGSTDCLLRIICAPLFPLSPAPTPWGLCYGFPHSLWSRGCTRDLNQRSEWHSHLSRGMLGTGLSFKGCTDRLVKTQAFRAISGI